MGSITYKEYNEIYRLPEQQRDEELIMLHKHHALCYEPGKGKSYPAIHCILQINKLKNNNAKVLIMSDATCIKDMWKAEIEPQHILPKETYFVTDRTAIGAIKPALLSTKWDLIVIDECFHPDTEILTEKGWMKFYNITNEKVAQYNDDGTIEFVEPIRKIEKDYQGLLHCLHSNSKTFKMTPHHMMVYDGIKEFAEKHNYNNSLIVSGKSIGKQDKLNVLDRIAIMCQADGTIYNRTLKNTANKWGITLSKERKINHFVELMTEAKIPFNEVKHKTARRFMFTIPDSYNISKDLTTYFNNISDKSSKWCEDFIYEESLWDGHFDNNNRFYYSSTNENNTKLVECILTMSNRKFNTSKIIDTRWSNISISYRVQSSPIIIDNKATRNWTTEEYSGKVYCVEVPSHMIIVRSPDGSAIVCGNCQSLRSGVTRAKSQYAKLVYQLCKRTEYVIGMTGTIAGNNEIEPFCVLHNLHIAGCGDINCHYFKTHYCVQELKYGPFGSFQVPTGLNEKGKILMQEAYKNGCSFWEYDDDDNMPEMDTEYVHFKVPETESYKNALQGILQCGDTESTVQKSIAIQKAQQALNGFIYYKDDKEVRQTYQVPQFDNPKLNWVLNECKDHICIVAYRFQEDGYYINKTLTDAGIDTTDNIQTFKRLASEGKHIILVIQCSRGKAANLQVCQHIIYYTCDYSFIYYKQMLHRTWRRGQDKKCRLSFLCNETGDKYQVEEKIWKALQTKSSIHSALMSIKRS